MASFPKINGGGIVTVGDGLVKLMWGSGAQTCLASILKRGIGGGELFSGKEW